MILFSQDKISNIFNIRISGTFHWNELLMCFENICFGCSIKPTIYTLIDLRKVSSMTDKYLIERVTKSTTRIREDKKYFVAIIVENPELTAKCILLETRIGSEKINLNVFSTKLGANNWLSHMQLMFQDQAYS